EEFAPRSAAPVLPRAPEPDSALAAIPAEDLLREVVRAGHGRSPAGAIDEAPPPETDGVDLVPAPEWMKLVGKFTLVFAIGLSSSARAATTLKIKPLRLHTSSPEVVFETDARPGETV